MLSGLGQTELKNNMVLEVKSRGRLGGSSVEMKDKSLRGWELGQSREHVQPRLKAQSKRKRELGPSQTCVRSGLKAEKGNLGFSGMILLHVWLRKEQISIDLELILGKIT